MRTIQSKTFGFLKILRIENPCSVSINEKTTTTTTATNKQSSVNLVGLWAWESSPPDCLMRLDIEEWCEMTNRGNKVLFSS